MKSFRIATWNLNYVSPNRERGAVCRKKMDEVDADVWILTETRTDFVPTGFRSAAQSGPVPGLAKNTCWVSIWAKEPLSVLNISIPLEDPERTACGSIKLTQGLDLVVYGVVLPWHNDPRRGSRSWARMFKEALTSVQNDREKLRNDCREQMFCLAGDFNQALLDIPNAYGTKDGREALKETLRQTDLVCYTGGDLDPVNSIRPGHANIDHICFNCRPSEIDQITAKAWPGTISDTRVSDHFGVYVELPLP